ncbi:MAG: potassium transporter TrkA [Bacteroidetes bacterium]|nr:potassium transporter TrkA [Bacteroidota bacterium]
MDVENFGFLEAFWINLTHTLDPGAMGNAGYSWSMRIYQMIITIVGIVVLSTLIGLISNGILDKIQDLRKGRSFVIEKNHTLILGWSSKIFTIVPELVIANENVKNPVIVILADKDKVDMEDEIRDKIGNTENTRIICRTGNPIDISDLYIANPFNTRAIIILDKDNENSDSQIIKTILAIVTNPGRRKEPYHITAEIENSRNYEVAKMVGGDEVELILSDEFISRIMVQTSRQSGLSVVYIELMDFGGDEIYFYEEPKIVGKTFREVLFMYEESAIIGIQFDDKSVILNPPMDTVMRRGDSVIGVTEDDDTLIVSEGIKIEINESVINTSAPPSPDTERILILGWNQRAKNIVKELDNYVAHGSMVHIVTKFDVPEDVKERHLSDFQNITISYERNDTTDKLILEGMDVPSYDYVMLLCYQEHYPLQEADAQTLITLLHLRNISETTGKHVNLVSEMLDMKNRQLADITSADDFIVSDKLLSLLISQVAENKFLMRVFEDLFDADGSEIYIKPAIDYVQIGVQINFYTVLESAALKHEVAMGYRVMAKAKNADEGYGVIVNPKKSEMFELCEEDMIIVLSED